MTEKFPVFASAVEARFRAMSAGELLSVDSPDIFDIYLAAFPEGTNPIFRVRTEHDCSMDKQFIRNLGRVVSIEDGRVQTVWDIPNLPYPYDVVAAALADHVKQLAISSVFRTKERKYGAKSSIEHRVDPVSGLPTTHRWDHFWGDVADKHFTTKPEEVRGSINTTFQVFKRGLDELTISAFDTVIDLIDSNSVYRGAEFRKAVSDFRELLRLYNLLNSPEARSAFAWGHVDSPAARFRNSAIGTLVVDLSSGEDLEKSVKSFESKVAPENYKRSSSLITAKMIEDAVGKLKSLELESAVERRHARLSDVSVNNVLFVDNSVREVMKDGIAGLLMESVKPVKVDIKNPEDISIDEFLGTIVPKASSIDLLLENKHLPNFMSLTAPAQVGAGQLFKWDNGFAWSYDGDVADSIKHRVKRAGGSVDGVLRVSLAWSNYDDLDLHVHTPDRQHIYYGNPGGLNQRRVLDVDMNAGGARSRQPVENLAWDRMPRDGLYKISVNQFSRREQIDVGFTLEVESGGQIHNFNYDKAVAGTIQALTLKIEGGQLVGVSTGAGVVGGSFSQEKWGVNTETLVPVNTMMASPNHWDGQGVGNKHWFFILKDCKNPEPVRGIYNEFLKNELDPHRKVFEVLGAKSKCPVSEDQLSGIGFSSTRSDKAIVVVKGNRLNKAFNVTF
jgi:hypothetical protein